MKRSTLITYLLAIIICFVYIFASSACNINNNDGQYDTVSVVHPNFYADNSGLVYDDFRIGVFKCYFDFKSMTNIYFCSKPNCDHTDLDCSSRLCYPYTFFIGDTQYFIIKNYEMNDSNESFVSYLFKSDISNTEARLVVKLDCDIINEIYLVENTLNIVAAIPKFLNGISTSAERWDLYQINMNNYKVKKITLNSQENIDGYIPYGVINNNMIVYHRYYDKIINPDDYGLEDDITDYMKDEENYRKYIAAVMDAFHEEMVSINLHTGEQISIDMPIPLLVYRDCYYYNKEKADGSHELVSYNFITGEEFVIYNSPVKTCNAIGDKLFFTEGIETISNCICLVY